MVTDNEAIADAYCQGEAAFAAASAGAAAGTSTSNTISSSGDAPGNLLASSAAPTAPQAAAATPDAASAAANLGNVPADYGPYEEFATPSMSQLYGPSSGLQYNSTPLQGGDIFQDHLQLAGYPAGASLEQPMPPSYEVVAPYVSAVEAAAIKAPNTLCIAPSSGFLDLQAPAVLPAAGGPEAEERPAHLERLMLLGMAPSLAAASKSLEVPHIASPQPPPAAAAAAGGGSSAFEGYPNPLAASWLLGYGLQSYDGGAQVTAADVHYTALEQQQQGFYDSDCGYGGYAYWQDPAQTFTSAAAAAGGPLQGLLPSSQPWHGAGPATGEPQQDSGRRPRRAAAAAAQGKPTFVDCDDEFDELYFFLGGAGGQAPCQAPHTCPCRRCCCCCWRSAGVHVCPRQPSAPCWSPGPASSCCSRSTSGRRSTAPLTCCSS